MRRMIRLLAAALGLLIALPAAALDLQETPSLAALVESGALPPVAERAPAAPLVVDLAGRGREIGRHGGEIRTLIGRARDVRMAVVYGYARLVGYDADFTLVPDILESLDVEEGRRFTLRLRPGHRWSDGHPFTAEDFRYWWEDVANNPELSPAGPPSLMLVDGAPPVFTIIDETTVRYEWPAPNPQFLPALAAARPPFIYRPAHHLKQFHAAHAEPDALAARVAASGERGWAPMHNRRDAMYDFDDPALPTLQPWRQTSARNGQRYILQRNPFYHRVDPEGRQLPYVDRIEMTVAAPGLIPARVNRGEVDLQVRGLSFSDGAVLKRGEAAGGYVTYLWTSGYGSEIALYPSLTVRDPAYRALFRDVRFRRALSLGINRRAINRSLFFGLAEPVQMAALPQSPFFDEDHAGAWAHHDPAQANALLDEIVPDRGRDGFRRLPDGRLLEIVAETAGERREEIDALELIAEMWREIGVRLIFRPLDRDILRNRAFAGEAMMPVWFGWNRGVPTPEAPPTELAPVDQSVFSWPHWGQHHQTAGAAGEPVDLPEAERLMALFADWSRAATPAAQAAAVAEMLAIHADQVFAIGLVSAAPQPIAVSRRLRNFPERAVFAWDPGAHLGVHRIDELFYADAP
ncbi:MAG: ABC transporter substrate-binding protein [Rhodobacteraceae bacterium]|nr:MAG: ABC transporter substrate-binding protein [Paracoccaceae bacterium]